MHTYLYINTRNPKYRWQVFLIHNQTNDFKQYSNAFRNLSIWMSVHSNNYWMLKKYVHGTFKILNEMVRYKSYYECIINRIQNFYAPYDIAKFAIHPNLPANERAIHNILWSIRCSWLVSYYNIIDIHKANVIFEQILFSFKSNIIFSNSTKNCSTFMFYVFDFTLKIRNVSL